MNQKHFEERELQQHWAFKVTSNDAHSLVFYNLVVSFLIVQDWCRWTIVMACHLWFTKVWICLRLSLALLLSFSLGSHTQGKPYCVQPYGEINMARNENLLTAVMSLEVNSQPQWRVEMSAAQSVAFFHPHERPWTRSPSLLSQIPDPQKGVK